MAIDNYLITNPNLMSLKLMGVKMKYDDFMELSTSIETSKHLKSLDLS